MRASAGTRSPASTNRMSPGTSPTASTSSTVPSRRTRAIGTCSWASASTLAMALRSWLVPMITLNSTSAITIAPVAIWSMVKLAMLTISSMMFIGLAICAFAICHVVGGGSVATSFLPYVATRLVTSAGAEPRRRVDTEPGDGVVDRQRVPLRVGGCGLLGRFVGHRHRGVLNDRQ